MSDPVSGPAGLFVSFEGPEGAGKSTVASLVAAGLEASAVRVRRTREPGGTALGVELRRLLLSPDAAVTVDERTELLLFLADRAAHVAQVIRPSLAAGEVVLCDRYVHSTLAYQGWGRGFPLEELSPLVMFAANDLLPDVVVLVDIDVESGRRRALGRGALDRMEAAGVAFHERVRDGFLALAAADPDRFLVVSGLDTPEQSAAKVLAHLAVTRPGLLPTR